MTHGKFRVASKSLIYIHHVVSKDEYLESSGYLTKYEKYDSDSLITCLFINTSSSTSSHQPSLTVFQDKLKTETGPYE